MDGKDLHGANLTNIVYGTLYPELYDESSDWFEASKIYRETMGWDSPGVQLIEESQELQAVSRRSGRVYPQLAKQVLPEHEKISEDLSRAIDNRRSADFFRGSISFEKVAGILEYSCGIDNRVSKDMLRRYPSAGALHPLDVLFYAREVDGLDSGLYSFIPRYNSICQIKELNSLAFSRAFFDAAGARDSGVIFLIMATFWRTRFKYGHRGSRFAFIEAGHLAQNMLLIAADYGESARPLGGFIDDELNSHIPPTDGRDSALIYAVAVG